MKSEAQAFVEMYSTADDTWEVIPSLPDPRVDFTLKVGNFIEDKK